MKARLALIGLATLLLSACYGSDGLLLNPDAAVHPLDDGIYARGDGRTPALRISVAPDGWYRVETVEQGGFLGETRHVLVNELPLADGTEGYALAEETDDGYVYAVARPAPGGGFYLAEPDCADPLDRTEAVQNGGAYDDGDPMSHRCAFADRQALLPALVAYAANADFGAAYMPRAPVRAPAG